MTAVLRAFALVGPPKTRFSLVVSLGEVGLITHQVPNEVSALSTFDFPFIQTLPGAMQYLSTKEVDSHASLHLGLLAQAKELRCRLADGQVAPFDVSDFVVRHVAIGHLVSHDLPLFAALQPEVTLPTSPIERPSLRLRLQRAIRG